MAEMDYIKRRKLWDEVVKSRTNNPHLNEIQRQAHIHEHRAFQRMIIEQPTADVVEVKHGYWEDMGERFANCSNCGTIFEALPTMFAFKSNNIFCRHCGAKMDGTPKERGAEE